LPQRTQRAQRNSKAEKQGENEQQRKALKDLTQKEFAFGFNPKRI